MGTRTRYDTSDVPFQDRFAFWNDAVCDSYVRLGCDTAHRTGFSGLIDISRHETLSISRVSGKSHQVKRRPCDIRASTDPFFLLSVQTARSSRVAQFGKTAALRTGDMALYSSTDPYLLDLDDDFSQMVLQVPAGQLAARLPNPECLVARRIDGNSGIGRLVRDSILAFAQHAGSDNRMLQTMVQETLIDLIATGLASQQDGPVQLSSPEQQVMLRAKAFVRANLGNPDLDRHMVAAEVGLSVRRLNTLFAKEGLTPARLIRDMRLKAVRQDLRDMRFTRQSITEIAFRRGFSNMQNFSTVFRSHSGQSPRAFRNGG